MAEKKESVEATVRTIRRVTRRKYSAKYKVRIALEGLRSETSVAAMCRREGIPSSPYRAWHTTPRSWSVFPPVIRDPWNVLPVGRPACRPVMLWVAAA
jgi:hypothetical protein